MLRSEVSITKIIGITGPTGAGKTTALNEVEKLGGAVIDCDAVYHELLESDIALQSKLEELGKKRRNAFLDSLPALRKLTDRAKELTLIDIATI